ncbi:DNA-directed RNA polymerase subunit beta [Candidatus Shapirobacteria bacterium CG09_land_8_20_14_0_10_39_12]|uniref:DNA-directed RNA polymerase subunit beta n=1 Tax=Candidatus Shapirobacteria bacterium CG09_land_8_20_14_0_10_39_12 TaxID=1974885 RepID=A0A2H0WPL5_9BACT|nr:MAG: DNA-directed RNA polymerase subunit beta [Candidatus Shapirobacteria bacterium CG09_land_8_20_14_0_10_39_12]
MKAKKTERINWGKTYPVLPPLDLIKVQLESWEWFKKEGLGEALNEISPIDDFVGKNWQLEFLGYSLGETKRTIEEAQEKSLSYEKSLKVKVRLTNKQSGKEIEQEVFLGDLPEMTPRGTFIINGIERCVITQIVRAPGAYFSGEIDPHTGRTLFMAEVRPMKGSWLEFLMGRNDVLSVRVDRRRKFPATVLLRAFGLSTDEEIINAFTHLGERERSFIAKTIKYDPTKTKEEALIELYKKLRPGEPAILENAHEFLKSLFWNNRRYDLSKVGRYKINKRMGLNFPNVAENWTLKVQDLISIVSYLINLQNGRGEIDDIDNLANRRVRRVGELVLQTAVKIGLLRLERMIKERMALMSTEEKFQPAALINARPLISAINEFYRQGQLSQILDQTNPLSELDNLRRLSVMGQGGITRERASFSIRDINSSQYSRVCPVRSPEGPNIGLVTYMSLYCRVNDLGFLEAPYFKVEKIKKNGQTKVKVTNEIKYLQADEEREHYITHSRIDIDGAGYIQNAWVPVRYQGNFLEVPAEKVDFIDVCPQQIVGTSASLIPFLANDEPNRALMGTHMQCQAVPLLHPEAPIIGTGMEGQVAEAMGMVIKARNNGKVIYIDANKVMVKTETKRREDKIIEDNYKKEGDIETYKVVKFQRTKPVGTCYSQNPLVEIGQTVKKGDIIIDGPAAENGELALGKNLLIAYCQIEGLGYEDAIIISERLVKEDLFTSISIEEYEAQVVDTKLGPEELTRDIPNVSEHDLANLAEDGIVVVGADVGPNDILVGKIAPKGETELSAEERLLRVIFGEKAREVRDTSLRMPHGERGTVVGVQILDREKDDELEPGVNKVIKVKVAQVRKITEGDKLAGRHGNKGVISKVVSIENMPYLEDGIPVDIIISPLSVLARMNLGQLLEAHLGLAAKKLGYRVAVPVFEEFSEKRMEEEMVKANIPLSGKVKLFDGKTGEAMNQDVTIGIAYVMKLIHMVEDKTHARSTGPYSLVTQQPLGGKAQMGGQRLGEMEVWALEAHRASHILQEMLTIKSDDVIGRAKAFEAVVKGLDIPEASVPESFNVLVNELKALGLNILPQGVIEKKEEIDKTEDKILKETDDSARVLEMNKNEEILEEKPKGEN